MRTRKKLAAQIKGPSGLRTALRVGVLLLAATRIVRFITTDWLGEWTVAKPLRDWGDAHERAALTNLHQNNGKAIQQIYPQTAPVELEEYDENYPLTWQRKISKIVECGYCLAPWTFGALLIGERITRGSARKPWEWITGTLAGSYIIGHLWNRLDT